MEIWQIGLAAWVAFVGLGAYVASQKRRSLTEGLILGLLFGPIGAIVEGLFAAGLDTLVRPWNSTRIGSHPPSVNRIASS
jgi:hypothetical protein